MYKVASTMFIVVPTSFNLLKISFTHHSVNQSCQLLKEAQVVWLNFEKVIPFLNRARILLRLSAYNTKLVISISYKKLKAFFTVFVSEVPEMQKTLRTVEKLNLGNSELSFFRTFLTLLIVFTLNRVHSF